MSDSGSPKSVLRMMVNTTLVLNSDWNDDQPIISEHLPNDSPSRNKTCSEWKQWWFMCLFVLSRHNHCMNVKHCQSHHWFYYQHVMIVASWDAVSHCIISDRTCRTMSGLRLVQMLLQVQSQLPVLSCSQEARPGFWSEWWFLPAQTNTIHTLVVVSTCSGR